MQSFILHRPPVFYILDGLKFPLTFEAEGRMIVVTLIDN